MLRCGAVLLLTSPITPLLWMGEEWAASTRWPFFTSHPEAELGAAVGHGRLREFPAHGGDVAQTGDTQETAADRGSLPARHRAGAAPHGGTRHPPHGPEPARPPAARIERAITMAHVSMSLRV